MRSNTLCALLFCLPLALVALPERSKEYIEHPPADRKERAQWRGDRYVTDGSIDLILDWSKKPISTYTDPENLGAVPLEIVLSDSGGKEILSKLVEIGVRRGFPSRNSLPVHLELPVDAGEAPWFVELKSPRANESAVPARLKLMDRREALARVAGPHRPEIASWIEEANHERLIWGKQPLWPNLEKALQQPDDPYADLTGFLIRSYESPHLRRRQPYTVYVPDSLDLSEPAPLMILLHGSSGDYRNLVADYAAGQAFEKHPMLIANAGAYLNTEFRHMALEDVRAIIEDMKQKYSVDASRIYAQGISLGGRGVLELAALMPDTFAAVSSQGTYGVYHEWMDPLYGLRGDTVARWLSARNDIRTWLPNLRTTAVEMVFGWDDSVTRPVGALAIGIVLERLGISVVERGFETGHNISLPSYDWASTREWMLQHRKEQVPQRISFRVGNLRYNRFAWLQIDALHDAAGIGEVNAVIRHDGRLTLETSNIAQLSIVPPSFNVSEATRFPLKAQTIRFDKEGNRLAGNADQLAAFSLAGPLENVFNQPLTIVVDDSVSAQELTLLKKAAERNAATDAVPDFRFPVIYVSELSDEERQQNNLFWISHPHSEHPWNEQLKADFPDAIKKEYGPLEDCLIWVRPSPWNEKRQVVVVHTALPNVPNLRSLGLFGEPLQADWLLVRGWSALAAGVFNRDGSAGPWTFEPFKVRVITR